MNVSDLPDPIKLTEPVLRPSLDGDLTARSVSRCTGIASNRDT